MNNLTIFNGQTRRLAVILLATLLTLGLFGDLYAQGNVTRFDHFSLAQGLSQNTVLSIVQDDQGFMWFGTEDGLNRFDGYTFSTYRDNLASDQRIRSLLKDRDGSIWVGALEGLSKLNPITGEATPYLVGEEILTLHQTIEGTVWVGTTNSLQKFDPETQSFTRYLDDKRVRAIYSDHNHLWVGTEGDGLYQLNPQTGDVIKAYTQGSLPGLNNTIRAMIGQNNILWLGTLRDGLLKFDTTTGTVTATPIGGAVIAIHQDKSGQLWAGTFDDGVYNFDPASGTVVAHYIKEPTEPTSLSANTVYSILEDESGLMWFGTELGGVNTLNRRASNNFPHYTQLPNDPNSLSDKTVLALYEGVGKIVWIGTNNGLNKFDRNTNSFTQYLHDPDNPDDPKKLPDWRATSVYEDPSGIVWLGTDYKGLVRFDGETFKPYLPPDYEQASVWAIAGNGDGTLWVGMEEGLYLFDIATERFVESYLADCEQATCLSNNNVSVIYKTKDGLLWIGTRGGGLNRFDLQTGVFTPYRHDPDNPDSLSNDVVWAIHEDPTDTNSLWVGTNNGGLNKLNRATGQFEQYTIRNASLPNNIVYGILQDEQGFLWLSTNRGLAQFNPQTQQVVKNYDAQDGLQSLEFQASSYHQGQESGDLYFGGINGFNVFNPKDIQSNLHAPPIQLTNFEIVTEGETEPTQLSIPEDGETVYLDSTDRIITFEFAALDYTNPAKNQYQHKLDGFDNDWIDIGNKQSATYTNLDSCRYSFANIDNCEYTFRVRESNNDEQWSDNKAFVTMNVIRPWWWKGSILILSGLFLLTLFVLVVRSWMRYREGERERKDAKRNAILVDKLNRLSRDLVNRITGRQDKLKELQRLAEQVDDEAIDQLIKPIEKALFDDQARAKQIVAEAKQLVKYKNITDIKIVRQKYMQQADFAHKNLQEGGLKKRFSQLVELQQRVDQSEVTGKLITEINALEVELSDDIKKIEQTINDAKREVKRSLVSDLLTILNSATTLQDVRQIARLLHEKYPHNSKFEFANLRGPAKWDKLNHALEILKTYDDIDAVCEAILQVRQDDQNLRKKLRKWGYDC
ncbi:two-component regulator propeller domain-containing protein [Anaerolineales bacterium HSG25]|nr:two-component regulator propeller domain-containing protein [Anaerolineales bacterium HSG25]